MTSVTPMRIKEREDRVTDGSCADDILANAPARQGHYSSCPRCRIDGDLTALTQRRHPRGTGGRDFPRGADRGVSPGDRGGEPAPQRYI